MKDYIDERIQEIANSYNPVAPNSAALLLKALWLEFEPNRGIELIKEEQRTRQESIGIPIPILKSIGKEMAKYAKTHVDHYIPLAQILWDTYGREGRVVSSIMFGILECITPKKIIPILKENCQQCFSWEDADRLAMDALEPAIRKDPEQWLPELDIWLHDTNIWVRRSAITVYGRLPMKHPQFIDESLNSVEILLYDEEPEVRKATSFAIRICAKTDTQTVCDFIRRHIPPKNSSATWVLCDVIRSIGRKQLPGFVSLLPLYKEWMKRPGIEAKDVRSIHSAVKRLEHLE